MEYKFRGKRTDTGEWAYGSVRQEAKFGKAYILENCSSVIIEEPDYNSCAMGCGLEDRMISDRYEAMEYGWIEAVDSFRQYFPNWIEVIPETVGQFTGLYDSTPWGKLTEDEKIQFFNLHKSEIFKTVEDVMYIWQGREIYEGDIVEHISRVSDKPLKCIIEYEENATILCINGADEYSKQYYRENCVIFHKNIGERCKVIGNKHDKELLEVHNE